MRIKPHRNKKHFWCNSDIVRYFEEKPADKRIQSRLLQLSNRNSLKALDLGCGGGRHTELLCELGFQTYACDINHTMLTATRKRVSRYFNKGNLSKKVVYSDMSNLPFPDAFFDVIVTTGVLHQAISSAEYNKTIKEVARVLKQGSIIALNLFTNKIMDPTFKPIKGEDFTVITKENLYMTLLPKQLFYQIMGTQNLILEEEISEDIKEENTGPRAVLRANFIKR